VIAAQASRIAVVGLRGLGSAVWARGINVTLSCRRPDLSERILVVARHGVAAIFSSLTFSLFLLATVVAMSGVRYDSQTGRVYVVRMPYTQLLLRPAADIETVPADGSDPAAAQQESAMSTHALLDRWTPYIEEASQRFALPASWIRAVIRQESGGRTVSADGHPITSQAGAQGLMQVMPETYDEARRDLGLGNDAYDPHDNVMAGASVLRSLYKKYGFPAMFAAYNDGPGNYEASLRGAHELPKETQDYLASVTAHLSADMPAARRRHRHVERFADAAVGGRG